MAYARQHLESKRELFRARLTGLEESNYVSFPQSRRRAQKHRNVQLRCDSSPRPRGGLMPLNGRRKMQRQTRSTHAVPSRMVR